MAHDLTKTQSGKSLHVLSLLGYTDLVTGPNPKKCSLVHHPVFFRSCGLKYCICSIVNWPHMRHMHIQSVH